MDFATCRIGRSMFRGLNLSSLVVLLLIVVVLFGTKRLREVGNDLAAAVKNFRKGMQEDDNKS